MNAGIEEAWIAASVGGLGIVSTAVVGIVSARNTRRTAIATIEAGHDTRLWEKQAEAYKEAVKEVLARRTRREALTSRGDIGNVGSIPIEELRRDEEPEIIKIRAGLRPYASHEVWAAYLHADTANAVFWLNLSKLVSANLEAEYRAGLVSQGVTGDQLPPDPDYQGSLDAMHQSKDEASDADEAFFDVINRELAWRPPRPQAGRLRLRRQR